jgi:hypothetical protein
MWKALIIVLVTLLVLFLAWIVLIGVVLVDLFEYATVCTLTFGLACKDDKVKKPKANSDK